MAMKTGLEDKKKVAIAVVLGVVVLFLVLRMAFQMMGGSAPAPQTVAQSHSVAPPPQATTNTSGEHEAVKVSTSPMAKLDPTLHPEWMAAAESLKYTGTGRNIFSMSSAPVKIEKPIGAVRPGAHAAAVAQGPPAPPAIDLKFFGFESRDGGTRKAFLLHGDDVFIASVGDVVDHRYKVVQIAPFSIQIQDIPYNDTQTLPLIQN
ncbi:MAG TPA: hypothetical protein VFL96_11705 [Acidobacteriaceae bacterium]|nr:hypothetical protein [Acidobacteriaceae bacterium]